VSDASDSGMRKATVVTTDRVLQTVGGILLTICTLMSTWTLKTVSDHQTKIEVHEAKITNIEKAADEQKKDIGEKLNDIKRWIERVADKVGAK
jgi:hypothetical protein